MEGGAWKWGGVGVGIPKHARFGNGSVRHSCTVLLKRPWYEPAHGHQPTLLRARGYLDDCRDEIRKNYSQVTLRSTSLSSLSTWVSNL